MMKQKVPTANKTTVRSIDKQSVKQDGFTLVEIMISAFVFTILAAGLFASALFARYSAEMNVRESIASAVAMGFLEQISATDYTLLEEYVDDRTIPFDFVFRDGEPLTPQKTLAVLSETNWGTPIELPIIMERDENDADGDGNTTETIVKSTMDFWMIPCVERSAGRPDHSMDITIKYRWNTGRSHITGNFHERTMFFVLSRVRD